MCSTGYRLQCVQQATGYSVFNRLQCVQEAKVCSTGYRLQCVQQATVFSTGYRLQCVQQATVCSTGYSVFNRLQAQHLTCCAQGFKISAFGVESIPNPQAILEWLSAA